MTFLLDWLNIVENWTKIRCFSSEFGFVEELKSVVAQDLFQIGTKMDKYYWLFFATCSITNLMTIYGSIQSIKGWFNFVIFMHLVHFHPSMCGSLMDFWCTENIHIVHWMPGDDTRCRFNRHHGIWMDYSLFQFEQFELLISMVMTLLDDRNGFRFADIDFILNQDKYHFNMCPVAQSMVKIRRAQVFK